MNQVWAVPLVARIVGYFLKTFGKAILEALMGVVKENDWRVGLRFLEEFHPRMLASFLTMLILEAIAMSIFQERWTNLLVMDWWQSIGVAFAGQAGLQEVWEIFFGEKLQGLETRYRASLYG